VALIDEEDADAVLNHKWHVRREGRRLYYAATNVHRDGQRTILRLHTFLTGWPIVDHQNHDGLDNRRSNLRQATKCQNQQNQRLRSDNKSGYKGVFWDKRDRKWHARIRANGRAVSLRYHLTAEDAARAYDAAARELHGEFAWLNFPEES
jgi:hypothetical protein